MTPERRKALLTLAGTLTIGLLVGILISALWNNYAHRRDNQNQPRSREGFITKVLKVVDADSAEAKQIRPIIKESMVHIDSVQKKTDQEIKTIIDSVDTKLKAVLPPAKYQKFSDFVNKSRLNMRNRERENQRHHGSGKH